MPPGSTSSGDIKRAQSQRGREVCCIIELQPGGLQEGELRLVSGPGVGVHVEGADGVLVFALSRFPVDVDGAAQADGIAFDVSVPQAHQLAGAHTGGDYKAIGIDKIIKDCFAVPAAGVYRKECTQRSGLKDVLAAQAGAFGDGQILGEEGGILMQAAPFDEGPLYRADPLQGLFAERTAQGPTLAVLLQAALLIGAIDDRLQMPLAEVADLQRAADREDVVFPIFAALAEERSSGGRGLVIEPLGIKL